MQITQTDFEKYIKNLTKEVNILKAKVDKVDKDKNLVNVKIFKGDEESDMILSNVKVPFVFGLNDEDEIFCLVAFPENDISNAFVLCFFSDTTRLTFNIDKTKFSIADNVLKLDINEKFKTDISESELEIDINNKTKINATDSNFKISVNDTTAFDLGSLIELKNSAGGLKGLIDDIWSEMSGLATAIVTFAGLVAAISYTGPGALVNTTGGGIADLSASIGTIETKAALVESVLK
ncbi:MAG TPA: hypothetical protein PK771_10535 [Spirochaetota bacterium]|nr:hypothetical protein [Spirochaetota bacterium]